MNPERSRKKPPPRPNRGKGRGPYRNRQGGQPKPTSSTDQRRPVHTNSASLSNSDSRSKKNKSDKLPPATVTAAAARTTTPPNPAKLLRNGEKGAEAHTVSETERIRLTRLLMDLRESNEVRLEFPPTLTNTERKFVHQLSMQLGLVSKSSGKGDNRRIAVTKRNETVKTTEEDNLPMLRVGKRGIEALKRHIQRFPPTHTEELESHETGASLVEALTVSSQQQGADSDAAVESTLNQFGLGVNKEASVKAVRQKPVDLEWRRQRHAAAQKRKRSHRNYHNMQKARSRLPAYSHRVEIVATVRDNPVSIIQGDTGSGKSTQVGQFLLDANPTANIVVTQPRRISAISVAERVAEEQCLEPAGGIIGYQVRLESAVSSETQLLFLTPGVLLRKLQSSPLLHEFTHVIIDEIHERDKFTEFLLIALRDLLPQRSDLRIILMSATLQTRELIEYWYGFPQEPAQVKVEGRTFPVEHFFLEQVLRMTGYIDAISGEVGMEQLEAEMATLTHTSTQTDVAMTCVMCGKSGFADALELGAHVALCDGGAGESMDMVEARVRSMDATAAPGNHRSAEEAAVGRFGDLDADEDNDGKKWDGISPFEVAAEPSGPTLTEEALLDQYQTMHDDEQVDYVLLFEAIRFITKSSYGDGAILVFFPGWQEISEFTLLLENSPPFQDRSKYLVLPLHSGIPSRDQRKVLQRPPRGVRKIVLSTNIAETSLTIEDVAFVVDTGRAKEKSYDPHLKTSTLQPTWISKASTMQRRGRAGRTKAGVCFHLFSSRRYASLRPFVESELLRTPLEEMCLQCKKLNLAPGGPEDVDGVPAFLAKALSPPHTKSVTNALDVLVDLGAMEPETNNLTSLGQCLSILSLEPRVGKMVIWSYLLGCARVASTMAVAMSYKSPFILPPASMRRNADTAKVQLSQSSESDQLTILYALRKKDQLINRQGVYQDFCRRNFLSTSTLQMISDLRKNLARELTSLGFPFPAATNQYHNRHDNDQALWQAAIAAGLYPNVASRRRDDVNFSTMTNRKAKIHVSSVNAVRGQPLNAKCQVAAGELEFVAFGEMVKGPTFFTMNQTTHLVSPLPLLLLCGSSLSIRPLPGDAKLSVLGVDDWIVFKCDSETASRIVILRKRLEKAFWRAISEPSAGLMALTDVEQDAVEILGTVLQSAHRSASVR